jgi:tRNA(fMet)-specific endonuclease VapC
LTAPRYLLDTSIASVLLRDPFGPVATRVTRHGVDRMCTSIIVAAELRFGAVKAGSPRLLRQIEGMLGSIAVLPFEPPADQRYAELRAALERAGPAIGPNDMLIAAHALALGCTIVTGDVVEFSRVKGLRVENWLQ